MKRVFDYGGRLAERVVTVAELQANTEPHRYSMTSPVSAEEAADAAAAGIHALSIWDTHTAMIRETAPTQFICAAQSFTDYATHDDILRGAMSALDAGADVIGIDGVQVRALFWQWSQYTSPSKRAFRKRTRRYRWRVGG